jgi:hypothetical protein
VSKSHRSRNLGLLARRLQPLRQKAVVALNFGLDILVAGMAIRAPRGRTLRLLGSIGKTKVKNDHARHRLYGRAYVGVRYAIFVNYGTRRTRPQPFVTDTQRIDGPHAVSAMRAILLG